MVDVAKVKLYGETIGIFRWDGRNNIVQFENEKNFKFKRMKYFISVNGDE